MLERWRFDVDDEQPVDERGGQRIDVVGGGDTDEVAGVEGYIAILVPEGDGVLRFEERVQCVPWRFARGADHWLVDFIEEDQGRGRPGLNERLSDFAWSGATPRDIEPTDLAEGRAQVHGQQPVWHSDGGCEALGDMGLADAGRPQQQQRRDAGGSPCPS